MIIADATPLEDSNLMPIEAGQMMIGQPAWVIPALVLGAAVSLLVVWNYARSRSIGVAGWMASLLKLVAVCLIAFCLLEPLMSGTRPRPQANVMPILVDNSKSMKLTPKAGQKSRGDRVLEMLERRGDWRTRLAQDFDVRTYTFDRQLEPVESFGDVAFDGDVSAVFGSLRSLADRFADRPVGGVLLFSDGNMTDAVMADADWSKLGFPVYPVVAEGSEEMRDLRIGKVSVRQTDFESAPITIQVVLDHTALAGQAVLVELTDLESGEVVEKKTVRPGTGDELPVARFRFRPQESGIRFYRVSAFLEDDDAARSEGVSASEATLENNLRLVAVDRDRGPYRILYVAGRPNWEFKFLRRALDEDAEVQLVGLLRMAKEEPKFSFRDRGVNTTNPLFAGLGSDEEEAAEQYDEPVIIRLGVKESEELSEGFPDTAEELFAYHGIILDDIEPDFFTQDEMLLVRRFVAARGGGLLMLGGQESFAGEEFGDSPLGELSPVYAPDSRQSNPSGKYRLQLTREGLLQPWARLRDTESAEAGRLKSMPPFTGVNPVGRLKPGATQIGTFQSDDEEVPALIAQRFGKGRTAAFPVVDGWRWSMRREDRDQDDPAQAWRQLTHWLVNEVPRRVELRINAPDDASKPVQIVVTARDEAYLPLDNAHVELQIEPLDGDPFELNALPMGDQPGVYAASYWVKNPGGHRVGAKVTAADGSLVGTRSSGWASDPSANEFRTLETNRDLLTSIAAQTGGEVIEQGQLEDFVSDLPNRKVPVTETWVFPVWHRSWIMLTALLCLCGEWGLRRWKGLA